VLVAINLYCVAVGAVLVLATHDEEKVLNYDEKTMQMTTLMYRMSVAKFLVDLCQSFVNIIFSALALHDAYNGNYLYLPDEQLEESDTVRAVSGFTYLMAALIAPVVSGRLPKLLSFTGLCFCIPLAATLPSPAGFVHAREAPAALSPLPP